MHLNVNAQSQRAAFKEELLTYLQSVALHYQDIRVRGSRNNKFLQEYLQPRVGDVVMYLDSKKMKKFSLIHAIIDSAIVVLAVMKNHKKVFHQYATRQLQMLYRSTEWTTGLFSELP